MGVCKSGLYVITVQVGECRAISDALKWMRVCKSGLYITISAANYSSPRLSTSRWVSHTLWWTTINDSLWEKAVQRQVHRLLPHPVRVKSVSISHFMMNENEWEFCKSGLYVIELMIVCEKSCTSPNTSTSSFLTQFEFECRVLFDSDNKWECVHHWSTSHSSSPCLSTSRWVSRTLWWTKMNDTFFIIISTSNVSSPTLSTSRWVLHTLWWTKI